MSNRPWEFRKEKKSGGFSGYREKLAQDGALEQLNKPVKAQAKEPVRKPSGKTNILWIMADQLRADTFGFLGHPLIKTPNIDRLASEGTSFTNSFCTSPVCMPSRASFMTGHYPFQTGVIQNGYSMRESEKLFSFMLKENGYRTANIGKNHAGWKGSMWEFNESFEDVWGATAPSKVRFQSKNFPNSTYLLDDDGDPDCMINGVYPAPVESTKSYGLTNLAMKWLYYNDDARPWILRVSYDDPHPPVCPPEPFASMYNPKDIPQSLLETFKESMATKPGSVKGWYEYNGYDRISNEELSLYAARYFGLVSHLDAQIGRLLDYLEETGWDENTAIILNSDHGNMLGEHGLIHKGPYCYEGVVKIPTIIKWKGVVEEGKICNEIIEGVDFVPTVLDITKTPKPDNLHGQSLLPVMSGDKKGKEYAFITWDDYGFCLRGKEWKITYYDSDKKGELYNILEDPYELVNLYDKEEYFSIRDEMLEKLNEYRGKYAPRSLHPYLN